MPVINHLVARDSSNPAMLKALIALAVITTCLISGITTFTLLRLARRRRAASAAKRKTDSQWRRLTIETMGHTATLSQEKRSLIDGSSSPPTSPIVPEIRITLPDEVDKKTGRPQSGRVVVVRMGENASVGLEPLEQVLRLDEQLPAY